MSALQELLDKVSDANGQIALERQECKNEVAQAIRAVEAALLDALGHEPLRGLKNLASSTPPFYAARLRGDADRPFAWPTRGQIDVPVILPTGKLVAAMIVTDAKGQKQFTVETRPIKEEEFRAEDLEVYLRKVGMLLSRHLQHTDQGRTRYAKIRELAERTSRLLYDDK